MERMVQVWSKSLALVAICLKDTDSGPENINDLIMVYTASSDNGAKPLPELTPLYDIPLPHHAETLGGKLLSRTSHVPIKRVISRKLWT